MDTVCTWKQKLLFSAAFRHHEMLMDTKAPVGSDLANSPKEAVLGAICGCSGMDVVSLLRKGKQTAEVFKIDAHADLTEGHPAIFKQVHLVYKAAGAELTADVLLDAVTKSMTLYCGVSAMIAKSCPISYDVELNGAKIGSGVAKFPG